VFILNQHKVIKILGEAEPMKHRFDHIIVNYWGVPVVLEFNGKRNESIVSFDTLEKAQKLQLGDVFMR